MCFEALKLVVLPLSAPRNKSRHKPLINVSFISCASKQGLLLMHISNLKKQTIIYKFKAMREKTFPNHISQRELPSFVCSHYMYTTLMLF